MLSIGPRRRLAAFAALLFASAALSTAGAAPAQAAAVGYVRLAHLSPDTPNVDVYLSSQSGAIAEKVFPGVGYGVMSQYLALPVGGYVVAMRASGAPKTDPPVLTTQVTVAAKGAYTVAGVGRYAELGLKILNDDLSLPTGGKSKVRIVQASVKVPLLGVSLPDGTQIAGNVNFASTTPYSLVTPGNWQLVVHPADGKADTHVAANLGQGNVYSLLILDSPAGGLKTELRTDASRQGIVPQGGVQTGEGGSNTVLVSVIGGTVLLMVVAVGMLVRLRRRNPKVL